MMSDVPIVAVHSSEPWKRYEKTDANDKGAVAKMIYDVMLQQKDRHVIWTILKHMLMQNATMEKAITECDDQMHRVKKSSEQAPDWKLLITSIQQKKCDRPRERIPETDNNQNRPRKGKICRKVPRRSRRL